jgi:signal recognition particle receptor subunit beta
VIAGEERPLPVVVCLNKQDLPEAVSEEKIRTALRLPSSVPVFRSIAKEGFNIMEAFYMLFREALRASVLMPPLA